MRGRRYPASILSTASTGVPHSGVWSAQQHYIQIGQNSWGIPPFDTMTLAGVGGTLGPAYPGEQAQYAALATIPAAANYSFADGYHYFDLYPGTYNVRIKGAEGSGSQHGYGADISATISVLQLTRMVALIGNAGAGSYGGGGGTFLAITTGDTFASATALLVAGGGGGGYSSFNSYVDAGDTNWSPTTRRGSATTGQYDGGASFSNVYNPEIYNATTGTQGSTCAQHFVWGGLGGRETPCGSGPTQQGGFGGGGGACPAGGGGFYGGKPGTSSGQTGGGGGTSYRLTTGSIAIVPTWTYNGTNGTTRTATSSLAFGSLSISSV